MNDFFESSVFFGAVVSLLAYQLGLRMKKRWRLAIFHPLLISIIVVILFLLVCRVDYASYQEGAKYLSYLLTPATVCLAIPLYEQLQLLKRNAAAIAAGIAAGVVTSLLCVLCLSLLFGFTHEQYVTLLPKSITTAIGIAVAEEQGGVASITAAVIIITGVFGNMSARIFRIREPIAKGIGLGCSAHAIGTVKAMEMGEVEGAISSLSIAVAGLLTVAGAGVFTNFL